MMYLSRCSASLLLVLVPAAFASPVTLTSSLTQKSSVCPEDQAVTFTCISTGSEAILQVNSFAYTFYGRDNVGTWGSNRDGVFVTLAEKYGTSRQEEYVFVTVLNVYLQSSRRVEVSCRNHQLSSRRTKVFYSSTAEPPAPTSVSGSANLVMVNNIPKVFFSISWSHYRPDSTSSIDHYMVQVDSHPPYHVSAKNTTAHLTMDIPDFHENIMPVITVSAVDVCGRSSNASTSTVDGFSTLFDHTTDAVQPTEQLSTDTEVQKYPDKSSQTPTDILIIEQQHTTSPAAITGVVVGLVTSVVFFLIGLVSGLLIMNRKSQVLCSKLAFPPNFAKTSLQHSSPASTKVASSSACSTPSPTAPETLGITPAPSPVDHSRCLTHSCPSDENLGFGITQSKSCPVLLDASV